jgi:hypothetical protein
MSESEEERGFDPNDPDTWDDAQYLRSEALLEYELKIEDPDNVPIVNYER